MLHAWGSHAGTGLDPNKVVGSRVHKVCVYEHCRPLGSGSTQQQVFKTLVRQTDNSNRIRSGNFFFGLKVAKKEKKKKKTNAAHVQDEPSK